jgi:hypothetical protein
MVRTGTCVPADGSKPEFQVRLRAPNGSGYVSIDVIYSHDGVSVWPDCDGPLDSLHTINDSNMTAWALLPNKKKAPLWVKIDPATDVVTSAAGQLNNLGLRNASDCTLDKLQFTDPAV